MPSYNSQQRAAINSFVEMTGCKESLAAKVSSLAAGCPLRRTAAEQVYRTGVEADARLADFEDSVVECECCYRLVSTSFIAHVHPSNKNSQKNERVMLPTRW